MINLITILRVFLLIPLGWAIFQMPPESWLPFIIFIAAALTDFFDGYLARKLNKTSAFGGMLDQICDKIFIVSALVLLVARSGQMILFIIPVILIIVREFLVAGFREFAAQQGRAIPVDKFGKVKTVSQFVAIACMLCPGFVDFNSDTQDMLKILQLVVIFTSFIGIWIAAVLGWISAVRYFNALKPPQ